MALPDTIIAEAALLRGYNPPHKSSGGNYYVVIGASAEAVTVHKNSDPGTSSWSEQDSANKPATTPDHSLSSVSDGTVIHITDYDNGIIRYHRFNMSTDSWEQTDNTVVSYAGDMDRGDNSVSWCSIAIRAGVTGDELVIAAQGLTDADMGSDYERVDFWHGPDSGTPSWTGPVSVDARTADTDEIQPQLALGTNDKIHLLYNRAILGSSAVTDYSGVTISTSNALSTIQDLNITNTTERLGFSNAISFDDGGTQRIWIAYVADNTDVRGLRAVEDGSDDIGSLTEELVSTTDPYSDSGEVGVLTSVVDGATIHVVFAGGGTSGVDQDLYRIESTDGGDTWSSETEELDAVTINFVSADVLDSGTIAYLYDDGGTIKYNEISLSNTQQIDPTGLASTLAFGTATIQQDQQIDVTGIASTLAFGTAQLDLTVPVTGVASTLVLGTSQLNIQFTAGGIPSTLTFGTSQLNTEVSVEGLASTLTFGTTSVANAITPTGIASTLAFGTGQLNITLPVESLASGLGIGTVTTQITVTANGIASTLTFGSPDLDLQLNLTGLASNLTFGTTQLNLQLDIPGLDENATIGSHEVQLGGGNQQIDVTGLASTLAFGTAQLNSEVPVEGLASTLAIGTASASYSVNPTGIESTLTFGSPQLNLSLPITGLASGLSFGTTQLDITVDPAGVASTLVFGSSQVNLQLDVPGVASTLVIGTAQLDQQIYPTGLDENATIGSHEVTEGLQIEPTGLASTLAFGTTQLNHQLTATGLASTLAIGTSQLNLEVSPTGIASTFASGTPQLDLQLNLTGVASALAFGVATIQQTIEATGIASTLAFGTASAANAVTPAGIASALGFGTAQLNQRFTLTGVDSSVVIGSPRIDSVTLGVGFYEFHNTPSNDAAEGGSFYNIDQETTQVIRLGGRTGFFVTGGIESTLAFGTASVQAA